MPLFIVGFILLIGLLIYAIYYYFIQNPNADPSNRRFSKPSKPKKEDSKPKVIYFPEGENHSRPQKNSDHFSEPSKDNNDH